MAIKANIGCNQITIIRKRAVCMGSKGKILFLHDGFILKWRCVAAKDCHDLNLAKQSKVPPELEQLSSCIRLSRYRCERPEPQRFKFPNFCPVCDNQKIMEHPTRQSTLETRSNTPTNSGNRDSVHYEPYTIRPRPNVCMMHCKHPPTAMDQDRPVKARSKTDHIPSSDVHDNNYYANRQKPTTYLESPLRAGYHNSYGGLSIDYLKRSHFTSPVRAMNTINSRENSSPAENLNFLNGISEPVRYSHHEGDKSPTRKILEDSVEHHNYGQSTFRKILDESPNMTKETRKYVEKSVADNNLHVTSMCDAGGSPVKCSNASCNGVEPLKETHITNTVINIESRYCEEVEMLRGKLRELTGKILPKLPETNARSPTRPLENIIKNISSAKQRKNTSPELVKYCPKLTDIRKNKKSCVSVACEDLNTIKAPSSPHPAQPDVAVDTSLETLPKTEKRSSRRKTLNTKVKHIKSTASQSSSDSELTDSDCSGSGGIEENDFDYDSVISELLFVKNDLASFLKVTQGKSNRASGDRSFSPSVLRPSLFPHVPPYLVFSSHETPGPKMPASVQRQLKWRLSNITPVIVRKTLTNTGFRLVRKSSDWVGVWGKHIKSPMFRQLKDFQKMNHFPGTFQLGRKDRLWRNAQRLQAKYGLKEFDFIPKTFILPQDLKLLRHTWEKWGDDAKWILKPPASARGTGIRVVNKWVQVPKKKPLVVQKYIDNPYLINGSKFDLRLYVLLTSVDPLRIYLYPDGLARFASVKYSSDESTLENRYMHLTNYSINKLSKDYTANEDAGACQGHKWTIQTLWDYLGKEGVDTDNLWTTLQDLVIRTMICGESGITQLFRANVTSRYNCYELFGVDVLLDENLKPWLLEVNISPSLHSSSPLDMYIKGPLVQSLLNIAQYHIPNDKFSPAQRHHVIKSLGLRECKSLSLRTINPLQVDLEDRPHTAHQTENGRCSPTRRVLSHTGSGDTSEVPLSFDARLYSVYLTKREKAKHTEMIQYEIRDEYLEDILKNLTPDDVRHLLIAEDELQVAGSFQKIFPTDKTYQYLPLMETRYYDRLFDAWETKYTSNRIPGITILQGLCDRKYHLIVPPPCKLFKETTPKAAEKAEEEAEAEKDAAVVPPAEPTAGGMLAYDTADGPSPSQKPSSTKAVVFRAGKPRSGRAGIILKPFPRSYYLTQVRVKRRRPKPS